MAFRFKSDSDFWATIHALQVAAEVFEENAKGHPRIAQQFKDQAAVARRIAQEIEESDM